MCSFQIPITVLGTWQDLPECWIKQLKTRKRVPVKGFDNRVCNQCFHACFAANIQLIRLLPGVPRCLHLNDIYLHQDPRCLIALCDTKISNVCSLLVMIPLKIPHYT
nr:uncharacterized protein LOC129037050 [Pongo pygmaeus]